MTGRERLLRTFRKQPVDRIAISPFLYYNSVYEMFDYVPGVDCIRKIMDCFYDPADFDPMVKLVEYCRYFGFDVLHNLGTDWWIWQCQESREAWDVTAATEAEGDQRRISTVVRTPDGELRQVENVKRNSKYLVVRATNEYFVKTREDFEMVRKYGPPTGDVDLSLVLRAKEAVGDSGMMSTCVHGAFNWLAGLR